MTSWSGPVAPTTVSEKQRLHPLSWLFTSAQAAKGFIIPLVLLLFASGGSNYELWAALVIITATAGAVIQYIVFRYDLGEDELVIRDGVFTRTERHIPYARIQNIDLVQNPLHRMLDVALVRIETASGDRPEAVIRVLSLDKIDEMRARVFADRRDAAETTRDPSDRPAAKMLLQLSGRELGKLGIISNKGLVVVTAILGVLWQQGRWLDLEGLVDGSLESDQLADTLSRTPVLATVLVVILVVVAAALLLRALSIAWFMVQLHGFTLTRSGTDLRTEYGLFTRISRTIPTPRIQSLTTTASPLHRWFNRQSIELRTVGGSGEDLDMGLEGGRPKAKSQWLAPMIDSGRVPNLLKEILSSIDLDNVNWEPIAQRAWLRIFRRGLIVVALVTIVVGGLLGSWLVIPVFAVPASLLALVHARLFVRHASYSLTPWGVVFKSGWWDRSVKLVRYSKIQTVEHGETPFDRRTGMASVRIDIAGAERIGHTIDIPFLESGTAAAVSQRLHDEVSRREFRW